MIHPYLSRKDIEKIAQDISQLYKATNVSPKRLCYNVDPVALANELGLAIVYRNLSENGTILGLTSPNEGCITILDNMMEESIFFLDGQTILIEGRLRNHIKNRGKLNFTIAHEIAHQVIYRLFPEYYTYQYRMVCDYRSPQARVKDWHEWQADTLGAAILLPEDAVRDAMFFFGLGEKMTVLSQKYSPNKFDSFCMMADFLGSSRSALSYRMEQLGLLERNSQFSTK